MATDTGELVRAAATEMTESQRRSGRRPPVVAQMRRLLGTGKDRAGVLTHFIADLGPEDAQLLAELLRDLESGRHAAADDSPTQAGD